MLYEDKNEGLKNNDGLENEDNLKNEDIKIGISSEENPLRKLHRNASEYNSRCPVSSGVLPYRDTQPT